MHCLLRLLRTLTLLGIALTAPAAQADILGFGDFSGWKINQGDGQAAPVITQSPSTIHLTGPASTERRSIFFKTPQTISPFSASFTYQETGNVNFGGGFAFVLENSSSTFNALGSGLGYSGISPSTAVEFQLTGSTPAGIFTDGSTGTGTDSLTPVILSSGDPINVLITYDGSFLHESVTDTITHQSSATGLHLASLPATAYIGITAGTSDAEDQLFSNFQFTAVPEPSAMMLFAAGSAGLWAVRRRRKCT